MPEGKTYWTRIGKVLTDADIEAISEVVPVRLDPVLRQAVEARAEADHATTSDIIHQGLRRFLDVPGSLGDSYGR